MSHAPFPKRPASAHHPGMLLVKLQPTAAPMAPVALRAESPTAFLTTPGLAAVTALDRAGLIKRVDL